MTDRVAGEGCVMFVLTSELEKEENPNKREKERGPHCYRWGARVSWVPGESMLTSFKEIETEYWSCSALFHPVKHVAVCLNDLSPR